MKNIERKEVKMTKKIFLLLGITVFVYFSLMGISQATMLTFEDLYPGYETMKQLPTNYGGFTWDIDAWWMTDKNNPDTGYDYGTIGNVSLFNTWANDISMSSTTLPFDFNGAYITAAWNIGEDVVVEGWLNGVKNYSTTIETSYYNGPYWFDFNFVYINELRFRSLPQDGINAGLGGTGAHIAIDNITYIPIPEPTSLMLLGVGLLGLAGWRRRKT